MATAREGSREASGRRRSEKGRRDAGTSPSSFDGRQRPANVDAERAVLGSILLKPDVCDDVALVVR